MSRDDDRIFQFWRSSMMAQGLSDRTVESRIQTSLQLMEWSGKTPLTVTADDIVNWLSQFPNPHTRSTYFTNLHALFVFMVRFEFRPDDPTTKIYAPKRPKAKPRPVTAEQIVRVLSSGHCYSMTRSKILLAALAGLRVHEIARVHGKDIDLDQGTILVRGKGAREDVLPLHNTLINLASVHPRNDWWFPSDRTQEGHVTGRAISSAISGAFKRCGIEATAHQLRHYFATSLLQAGVDSRTTQTLMRHESLATTAIYMQVDQQQQINALQQLPPLTIRTLF